LQHLTKQEKSYRLNRSSSINRGPWEDRGDGSCGHCEKKDRENRPPGHIDLLLFPHLMHLLV
jgi:hypothetical protein